MNDTRAVACEAAAAAGALLRARWGTLLDISRKSVVDLVTDADREAEAAAIGVLRHAFPDHGIIAEESAPHVGTSAYRWYVDPLDGTTNFAHRYPHFAVSIGLAFGDELVLGVVYDPLREELFVAERGNGATLNNAPIRVSTTLALDDALLATGFPYDRREHAAFYLTFYEGFLAQSRDVRRAGSAALDLCYVACGRLDGFWEWKLASWDTAAGALIVREAGGAVTDFRGTPFVIGGSQTLASNAALHDEMVRLLIPLLGDDHG